MNDEKLSMNAPHARFRSRGRASGQIQVIQIFTQDNIGRRVHSFFNNWNVSLFYKMLAMIILCSDLFDHVLEDGRTRQTGNAEEEKKTNNEEQEIQSTLIWRAQSPQHQSARARKSGDAISQINSSWKDVN